ncbi:MAG: hypothetical protein D6761_04135 [Candidatus Dadabacteria bacterium]|nr:MAG: hypothetical protein D6761_04135 [Candidatus Dadabacteria bacterium]
MAILILTVQFAILLITVWEGAAFSGMAFLICDILFPARLRFWFAIALANIAWLAYGGINFYLMRRFSIRVKIADPDIARWLGTDDVTQYFSPVAFDWQFLIVSAAVCTVFEHVRRSGARS